MANKHMDKYSPSVANREMQIKTILWFYFSSVRMATIQKSKTKISSRLEAKKKMVP